MGEKKKMSLEFASQLTDFQEVNTSFDKATMRICYAGANRNGSVIPKEVIEASAGTIYNCPVVCRYDRDTGEIGEHDFDVVFDDDGNAKMINTTTPIGVIPESANTYWETVTEEDGSSHEYFCSEVLLWKRQEAYEKIRNDGITKQSMEINVVDGETKNGKYVIYNYEYTAFCLLGTAEPCFESAALTFSKDEMREQFNSMMEDMKREFSLVQTSNVDVTYSNKEGGEKKLDEKIKLMEQYGLTVEKLGFKLEDYTLEELKEKFVAIASESAPSPSEDTAEAETAPEVEVAPEKEADAPVEEVEPADTGEAESVSESDPAADEAPAAPAPVDAGEPNTFVLDGHLREELERSVSSKMFKDRWGDDMPRYYINEYDADEKMVYVNDRMDGYKLFGMPFTMNGDSVEVNFDAAKRMKYQIVPFNEGESENLNTMSQAFSEEISKFNDKLNAVTAERDDLAKFKAEVEEKAANEEKNNVLEKFANLNGNEAFEDLKGKIAKFTAQEVEEKCYAILGRMQVNFSLNDASKNKQNKIGISRKEDSNVDPYGGIFAKYGIGG